MPFFPELNQQSLADLMQVLAGESTDGRVFSEEERPFFYEEVARNIAACGEPGLHFLLQLISPHDLKIDDEKLQAILLALTFAPNAAALKLRSQIRASLSFFLQHPNQHIVAQALDSLRVLGLQVAADEVRSLLQHESPYVVASILRFLSANDPEGAKPLLMKALTSPSPILRQNAIDELDDLQCVEALPGIKILLTDPDTDVRQAAQTAVANLEE